MEPVDVTSPCDQPTRELRETIDAQTRRRCKPPHSLNADQSPNTDADAIHLTHRVDNCLVLITNELVHIDQKLSCTSKRTSKLVNTFEFGLRFLPPKSCKQNRGWSNPQNRKEAVRIPNGTATDNDGRRVHCRRWQTTVAVK